ncbi:MAG: transcriptional regulator, partial [Pseudomonadota bacterium]
DEAGASETDGPGEDPMAQKEAMELVRSYYSIPENQRRQIFELARVLSDVV